jgi:hypothetical protein
MLRVQRPTVMALVVPPMLALACATLVSIAERSGTTVFSAVPPANLAEAAAMGRADDVVRRLGLGEDQRRVYDLRPEVISSAVLRATPVEAAMWSRQLLMVQLLDRAGAIADAGQRRALACLAADLELEDIVEYLSPAASPACVPQAARDAVLARSAP